MTAVIENSSSLATQCLEFCQALERQGKDFKLSITIGSTFTFSLDSRVGKATLPKKVKQRKSPSTLKRNAKRREEFLAKKSTSTSVVTGLESYQKPMKQNEDFQCNQCDANFKTVKGLRIHKGKSHKEASPQETLRESSSQPSLSVSTIKYKILLLLTTMTMLMMLMMVVVFGNINHIQIYLHGNWKYQTIRG